MRPLRRALLQVVRLFGGFALARRLTRGQLRILCYHGFALGEEYKTAPYVYMRPETFKRRMKILQRLQVSVLSLEEAIGRLRRGALVDAETVITFDDGWATNLTIGAPILREYGYPATIYITTEHLQLGTEAFYMALARMVYESPKSRATLLDIHPELNGTYELKIDPAVTARRLVESSARVGSLRDQLGLLRPIAAALGIDYERFFAKGRFRLLDADQIRALGDVGVDIELHTHTHSLPDDSYESAAREIEENRAAIRTLTGTEPHHFCYPSGQHSAEHPEWLARLGITSATTCDPGFNDSSTSLLLLRRHLDSEFASDIEFEAEIVGVRELLRRIRSIYLPSHPQPRIAQDRS